MTWLQLHAGVVALVAMVASALLMACVLGYVVDGARGAHVAPLVLGTVLLVVGALVLAMWERL